MDLDRFTKALMVIGDLEIERRELIGQVQQLQAQLAEATRADEPGEGEHG
jgi:hypothetical protein